MGVCACPAAQLLLWTEGTETPRWAATRSGTSGCSRSPPAPRGPVGSRAVLKKQSRDRRSVRGLWNLRLPDQIPWWRGGFGGLHRAQELSFQTWEKDRRKVETTPARPRTWPLQPVDRGLATERDAAQPPATTWTSLHNGLLVSEAQAPEVTRGAIPSVGNVPNGQTCRVRAGWRSSEGRPREWLLTGTGCPLE